MRQSDFSLWDLLWFFVALAVGLACSLPQARAEVPPHFGTVAGKVTDADDAPVAGAKVRVIRADHVVLTAQTDDAGDYSIDDVPAGRNEFVVESAGFQSVGPQGVKVQAGDTTWVNPTLNPNSK